MGIIMGTTTTINHHKATTQTCPRSSLSGHEKAMLSYNSSMAFSISVGGHLFFSSLFSRRLLSLMSLLTVVNILQVIPFAIEAEDIRLA